MLTLRKVRDLTLTEASSQDRPAYISAASGLVCIKSYMYVVADDELHLGVFRGSGPGSLFRIFDGVLPASAKDRKRAKPDFEALTFLPPFAGTPHGALLACGSGSRLNRRRGALIALDADGAVQGAARSVDLSCIMIPLAAMFADLNVEGVTVSGADLRVFQRGNGKDSVNAIIDFPLPAVLQALCAASQDTVGPLKHAVFDLGTVNGIPLTFTDAVSLPNGDVVFAAVAEDTDDPYQDGRCAGAAIGLIGADNALRWVQRLSAPHKIEGLDAQREDGRMSLQMVTDADDVGIAANLFTAVVSENGVQEEPRGQ